MEPTLFERTAPEGLETDAVDHADQVARLLVQLPPRQRAAMTLYYLEDLSIHDIATILRCSEGTVKSQLARGRTYLQRHADDPEAGSRTSGKEDDRR
jgi:RNA polymerase sigma factor (sigma-70 family)